MYGNGIGTLRVWVRPTDGVTEENPAKMLWEMSGDAGNNWYMAQLPIASANPFQIAFEGVIGNNYLGNIAIDSISIQQGSCPSKSYFHPSLNTFFSFFSSSSSWDFIRSILRLLFIEVFSFLTIFPSCVKNASLTFLTFQQLFFSSPLFLSF